MSSCAPFLVQRRAHLAVSLAVQRGELVRANGCQRCGYSPKASKLYGHHADYAKPLDVEWLCGSCHQKEHARMKRAEDANNFVIEEAATARAVQLAASEKSTK